MDGSPVSIDKIYPFFKPNPFKGGHKYCLVISKELYVGLVGSTEVDSIVQEERKARRFFERFLFLLEMKFNNAERDVEFMLNSIERVDVHENNVSIIGVCSLWERRVDSK